MSKHEQQWWCWLCREVEDSEYIRSSVNAQMGLEENRTMINWFLKSERRSGRTSRGRNPDGRRSHFATNSTALTGHDKTTVQYSPVITHSSTFNQKPPSFLQQHDCERNKSDISTPSIYRAHLPTCCLSLSMSSAFFLFSLSPLQSCILTVLHSHTHTHKHLCSASRQTNETPSLLREQWVHVKPRDNNSNSRYRFPTS